MSDTTQRLTSGKYLLGGFMKVNVRLHYGERGDNPTHCLLDFGNDSDGKPNQVEFEIEGIKNKDGTWRIKYVLGSKIHRLSLERA